MKRTVCDCFLDRVHDRSVDLAARVRDVHGIFHVTTRYEPVKRRGSFLQDIEIEFLLFVC
jgi:hypothetical protein